MKELIAKNDKQLGLCLRLMHAENVDFFVRVHETGKGKIYFGVSVKTDNHRFSEIAEKFRILTS